MVIEGGGVLAEAGRVELREGEAEACFKGVVER